MGEIIKHDFNRGKKTEASSTNDINTNSAKKENQISETTQTDKEKEIAKLAEPFLKFVKFVISDKHKKFTNLQITPLAFKEASEVVRKYSNEELIGWLVDHDESEWVVKPSFFKAVYEEMKSRLPESLKGKYRIGF